MKKNTTLETQAANAAQDSNNTSNSPDLVFAKSSLGNALLAQLQEGSASYKRIADYLLRNQVKVTALGIEDMAAQCDVSTATISRFARDLGFANYAALKNQIAETVQAIFSPVEKLRNTIEGKKPSSSPAQASLQSASANINAASNGLEEDQMQQVVNKLCKAGTVYIMGFGISAHIAGMLALHLQPYCNRVVEVVTYGGTEVAAGNLANITDKDVLVVISFPRYAIDVIRLTQFARHHSTCIVAITDSAASPLAQLGDYLLLAPSTHAVLSSSSTAAIAVIESLVSSIMVSNKKNVEKAIRLTEAISGYLHNNDNTSRTMQLESRKPKK
ncbi:MurR/RpiR family transcriptional regulator [Undibacterium cyanobacteriorum]|uniref:MurR/RpiR family transcriptional regulator n=1 Tax=Undibacterium cyanobacteriorum TaxID=3073561 RepID=A0ABY9RFX6_9BURK|nr:MurR/RpiR family transcriptional regulator [Undibacterium sp. 20NA77.5]WMW79210.1 MurR/RpiR family transcriptional regulator [Undibacterium sp. 20NA77.5]